MAMVSMARKRPLPAAQPGNEDMRDHAVKAQASPPPAMPSSLKLIDSIRPKRLNPFYGCALGLPVFRHHRKRHLSAAGQKTEGLE
jgi:hypothetical protein